jgi:hypothetical protein
MSLSDKAVETNRIYVKTPDPKLRERPTPRLAVEPTLHRSLLRLRIF